MRRLSSWIFGQAHPPEARPVSLEGSPLNVEIVLTKRGRDCFVHLVNFSADRRIGGPPRVHELTTVEGIGVRIRADARPKRIVSVPGEKDIKFQWTGGQISFQALPLTAHEAYRIEL